MQTHIDIYKYLQKNYRSPIIIFRKKGNTEDIIRSHFEEAAKNTASVPLKITYVDLPDSFSVTRLTSKLDSNKHTVCIAASLDENFGRRLAQQLASVRFMKLFYQRLQVDPHKARAFQWATAELRREYPHPFYWAPFVLVGKYG